MRSSNIDDISISQLCHAHVVHNKSGKEMFVNVYPHKIVLSMFEGEETAVVEVKEVEPGENSRYWAWFQNFSKQPYMFIWPSKEETLRCVPNYEQRTKNKEGRIVNVVVQRWKRM